MLTFMRNKIVGVEKRDADTFLAQGFLDDHIYSLTLQITVSGPERTVTEIDGQMLRYTTPDCPRACDFLSQALGLRLGDEDFTQAVHKLVGRQACRHFATLMLECCDCITKAAYQGEQPSESQPAQPADAPQPAPSPAAATPTAAALAAPQADYQALLDAPQGFFIDLHVHTAPASPCSSAELDELFAEAKRIGLDGICLTDHNYLWEQEAVEELEQKHGLLILRGNEVTTAQGDMLVFGLEQQVTGIITLAQLRAMAEEAGAFVIAAHPFRGFLTVGVDELGLDVEKAKARPMFAMVDALEVRNSKVTPDENEFSTRVAQGLGLPGTGGSDAHEVDEVGIFATRFKKIITNEADLVAALRSGDYEPIAYRKMLEEDRG